MATVPVLLVTGPITGRALVSTSTALTTVKPEIIENGARTSRISPSRLRGEKTVGKILQPSAEATDHTRRGILNYFGFYGMPIDL